MLRVQGLDKGAGTGAIVALAAGLAALAALLLASGSAPHGASPNSASAGAGAALDTSAADLPLAFEPNAGRGAERVDYLTHTAAGTVMLGGRGATLVPESGAAVALRLAGARDAEPTASERLPGVVNDLRGERSEWRSGLPTFERVRYAGVYPGTAIDWYGAGGTLEYDFRLAAGADPDRIAIRAEGADAVRVAANGELVIEAGGEKIRQAAPVAYQPGPAGRRPVDSAYRLEGDRIGFALGAYDRSRPLVIDPLLLDHSTYLGGAAADTGEGVAVDAFGAAYLVGNTSSSNATFNVTAGAPQGNNQSGSGDVFVSKFAVGGGFLIYSTYLGGDNAESAEDIAVDSAGAAYVTGFTVGTTFDVTAGAHDPSQNGSTDAFVTKLSSAGDQFEYSTFLGGTGSETGEGIAVDADGDVYVAGETNSTDFPVEGQVEADGGDGANDAFVTKLSPDATAADDDIAYSTYVGGSASDIARSVAVDASEAAYVVGETASTNFDIVGGFDGNAGGDDSFAFKLAPSGGSLTYSTYISSTSNDGANDVAVDPTGAAYVSGFASQGLETTAGAIQSAPAGGAGDFDAWVTKVDPAGSARAYATYLGGVGNEFSSDIALGPAGTAYLYGDTASAAFPTTAAARIETDSGGNDLYLAQVSDDGTALHFSTYLGGGATDNGEGVAVAPETGTVLMGGQTTSTDFDLVDQLEGDGGDANTDAILAAIEPRPDLAVSATDSADPVDVGDDFTYTVGVDNTTDNLVSTGVVASLGLGSDTVYRDAASDPRCDLASGNTVECDLGTVVGSDPLENVTIAVTAPDRSGLSVLASVESDQNDPVFGDNFENETTAINQSTDLAVSTTDSADPVAPGANYSYAVTVDNLGTSTSVAPSVFFTLPAGVAYRDSASSPACNPGFDPNTVRCDFFSLTPAAAPVNLTISVTAPSAAGDVTAATQVQGVEPDPVSSNNTDSETTTVATPPAGGGGGDTGGGDTGGGGGGGGGGGQVAADTRAPQVEFGKAPKKKSTSAKATFEFSADENGVGFTCKLDKAKEKACSSPQKLSGLKPGKHTFTVLATDAAGNTSTAVSHKWTVKKPKKKK